MSNEVKYTFKPPMNPDWGVSRQFKPRTLKAEFGDGYAQRAADGNNNNPVTLSLSWKNLTTEEKTSIVDFLTARKGYQSFWYTYEDETTAKAYVCEEFDYEHTDPTNYTITATFRQVYDIASSGTGAVLNPDGTYSFQNFSIALNYASTEYWYNGTKIAGGYTALPGYTFARANTLQVPALSLGLGPERMFATGFSSSVGWTVGSGWTIASGVATATAANGALVGFNNLGLIVGRVYRVSVTVSSYTNGTAYIRLGDTTTNYLTLTSAGTFTVDIAPSAATSQALGIYGSLASMAISAVSVKEIERAGSITYDMELAVNGTFDASTGWTTASGAAIANHVLTLGTTSGASAQRLLVNRINAGDEYEVVVNVKATDSANVPTVQVGQTGNNTLFLTQPLLVGKNTARFVATASSSTANITLLNTTGPGTTGTIIEDVSVKRMLRDDWLVRGTAELSADGDFKKRNGRNWTLTGTSVISGGMLTITTGTLSTATRTLSSATAVGEIYEATVVVRSETTDGFILSAGTVASPTLYANAIPLGVGTNIVRWTATTASTTANVTVGNTAGTGGGTIESISVRKLTAASFTSVAAGTPAINNGLGYFAFGALTNVAFQSQTFGTTWTATEVTVSSNVLMAPDGTLTADKVTPSTNNLGHTIQANGAGNIAPTGVCTYSVFAKAAGYSRIAIRSYDGTAYRAFTTFDLFAGSIVASPNGSSYIIPVGNGWYRCVVVGDSNLATAGFTIDILDSTHTAQQAFVGDGTSGVYLWQAQVVAGNLPGGGPLLTTTTASTATAANVWTETLTLDTDDDMVIYADLDNVYPSGGKVAWSISDGTANNSMVLSYASNNVQTLTIKAGGSTVLTSTVNRQIPGSTRVFSVVKREAGLWYNGFVMGRKLYWSSSTSSIFPAGMNILHVGHDLTWTNPINCRVRTIGVGKGTYTDAQILTLSDSFQSGTGAVDQNPYADYALALDFKAGVYYASGIGGALSTIPGYTYTRSGAKAELNTSGSAVSFAADVPGIISGLGYHARGAATNVVRDSNNLTGIGWSAINSTVTVNSIAAPDGTTTADLVTATAGTAITEVINSTASGITATAYTSSAFVKMGTQRYVWFGDRADAVVRSATFDLQAGTVVGSSNCTAAIIACANGWYRLVTYFTRTNTGGQSQYISFSNGTHTLDRAAVTVAGTETFYVWGCQYLNDTLPDGGPIIATTGSSASTGVDRLIVSDAPTDGDQLFWVNLNAVTPTIITHAATWDDTGANNTVYIQSRPTLVVIRVSVGGVFQLNVSDATPFSGKVTGIVLRSGGTWRAGKIINGTLTWYGAAVTGTFPPAMSRVIVGDNQTPGGAIVNCPVVGVHRKRLTDTSDANIIATVGTF